MARIGLLALGGLVAVTAAAVWLWPSVDGTGAGIPRLAVDRADIDLGYLRFDSPARVVFTLSNTGDGPLRLAGVPPVRAVAGC
jgi:hypothetical protein